MFLFFAYVNRLTEEGQAVFDLESPLHNSLEDKWQITFQSGRTVKGTTTRFRIAPEFMQQFAISTILKMRLLSGDELGPLITSSCSEAIKFVERARALPPLLQSYPITDDLIQALRDSY